MSKALNAIAYPFKMGFAIFWLRYRYQQATLAVRLTRDEIETIIEALNFNGGQASWGVEQHLIELRNQKWPE